MNRCAPLLALVTLAATIASSGAIPAPAAGPRLSVKGQALSTAIRPLSETLGVDLRVASELAAQRVTLLRGDQAQDAQTWRNAIQELLSPTSEAGVFWSKSEADAYWLHESQNREALAKRLADADQVFYRKWLADQVAWAEPTLRSSRQPTEKSLAATWQIG